MNERRHLSMHEGEVIVEGRIVPELGWFCGKTKDSIDLACALRGSGSVPALSQGRASACCTLDDRCCKDDRGDGEEARK